MKRIIICCDGTWNEPETVEGDRKLPTNVLKIVRATMPRDEVNRIEQIVYYDQGVGTGALGVLDRSIGGGTGYGISKNIRDCYNFLANNYVPGDDIFLFGFSRGAYTIRSLSGMIGAVGLLGKNDLRYVPQAYAYYHCEPHERPRSAHHALLERLDRVFPDIAFIGVWDTVGALGIPTPILGMVQKWLGRYWKEIEVGFHDCNLLGIVKNAYHALAIDERRGPFRPSIWDRRAGQANVQQVWFPGVHSDVGGGYPDRGLSDLAFKWMADRAREHGLVLSDEYFEEHVHANGLGKLEDSYSVAYKVLEYLRVKPYERKIGDHVEVGEMIHESVVTRIREMGASYRPRNVVGGGAGPDIVNESGRELAVIGGVRIPIYKERAALRRSAGDAEASITSADGKRRSCQVVDFTNAGGVRLRVRGALEEGERISIESAIASEHDGVVVWRREDEVGVRFVA